MHGQTDNRHFKAGSFALLDRMINDFMLNYFQFTSLFGKAEVREKFSSGDGRFL